MDQQKNPFSEILKKENKLKDEQSKLNELKKQEFKKSLTQFFNSYNWIKSIIINNSETVDEDEIDDCYDLGDMIDTVLYVNINTINNENILILVDEDHKTFYVGNVYGNGNNNIIESLRNKKQLLPTPNKPQSLIELNINSINDIDNIKLTRVEYDDLIKIFKDYQNKLNNYNYENEYPLILIKYPFLNEDYLLNMWNEFKNIISNDVDLRVKVEENTRFRGYSCAYYRYEFYTDGSYESYQVY